MSYTINFARPFLVKPEVWAGMATTNGGDASQLRLDGKTPNPTTKSSARVLVRPIYIRLFYCSTADSDSALSVCRLKRKSVSIKRVRTRDVKSTSRATAAMYQSL